MASIRDVAAHAGVSTATVSRVLNNDSTYKMKDETRSKVWRAVSETGYISKVQRSLDAASNPNYTIGCILSVTKDKYLDPYFMSVLYGIEARLSEKGGTLAFLKTYFELKDMQTFTTPPDGLIIMETLEPELYHRVRAQVPVCVGVDTLHEDIDNVGYDQFETAIRTTQFLISRGYRDIAFVGGGGPSKNLYDNRRFLGFLAAMQIADIPVNPDWVCDCEWDELVCIEQTKKIMQSERRPSAIYAASDPMAMAAMSALYSMRVKVPDDVAVIGLCNLEISKFSSPPLTTVDIPTYEMGQIAVDLLEMRLNADTHLPRRICLPTKLILRSSV